MSTYLTNPEHGTIDTSSNSERNADKFGRVRGYEGLYNYREPLWVATGSRIYGPKPHMTLNIAQDLFHDINNLNLEARPGLKELFRLLENSATPLSERIFTALDWYNDASTTFGDLGKSILSLAVAREWRFYTEGPPTLRRIASAHSFGSVMTYGRQIFQLCLETVLTGAALAEQAGLREKFISNGERYIAIARTLNDCNTLPGAQLASIEHLVESLDEYHFVGGNLTIEMVLTAVNASARKLLEDNPSLEDETRNALKTFTESSIKNTFESLTRLEDLDEKLNAPAVNKSAHDKNVRIVSSLVGIAWQTLALTYFHMSESQT